MGEGLEIAKALSEPANTLIKKIASGAGILYEHRRIVKKAEAEAQAKMIAAQTKIAIADLPTKAMTRFIYQEAKRQCNIDSIISGALPYIEEEAIVDAVENDWLSYFFKQCDTVSDIEMQSLWSKLLSGETNSAGSFSKRTIDRVRNLSNFEAEIFSELCKYCITIEDTEQSLVPFIHLDSPYFANTKLSRSNLQKLDSAGLIVKAHVVDHESERFNNSVLIKYFNESFKLNYGSINPYSNSIGIGDAILTPEGFELYRICNFKEDPSFFKHVVDKIKDEKRHRISSFAKKPRTRNPGLY